MRNLYTLYRFVWVMAAAALINLPALAQNQANRIPCYTDEHFAQQAAHNPQMLKARAELDAKIRQIVQHQQAQRGVAAVKRIVPIVFHVIHSSNGAGNLDRATILAALQTLNRDFSRQNGDTASLGSVRFPGTSMDIEFRLATKDPEGNCTDGITRHESDLSLGVEPRDAVKDVYSWPADRYFNVWVVSVIQGEISGAQGVIAGYAQFPMGQQGLNWDTWGVVVRSDALGSNDRTLSHEVGHCFNLYHTFQGECGSVGSDCSNQGDQVCDTPPGTLTQQCNRSQNTCRTDSPDRVDNIENFMSYDNCQNMFSPGQRARVYAAIAAVNELQMLSSPANLVAAGVHDGVPAPGLCPPKASFFAGRTQACGNNPITFFENSYNFVADAATRYKWIIEGSDSGTYNRRSPEVKFTQPGVHSASLIVTNASGADTMVRAQYIGARPATGVGTMPIHETFDAAAFPNVNPEFYRNWEFSSTSPSSSWETAAAGHVGTSVSVRHSGVVGSFSRYLTSPGLNLTSSSNRMIVYFWRAHKRRANVGTEDRLIASFSTDCGSSWTALKTWTDNETNPTLQLYTASHQGALYVDPAPADWKLDSVILTGRMSANARANVRIRFESVNNNSNTLFLDDIYVGTALPVGVRNQLSRSTAVRLEVMPNPGTQSAEIKWVAGRSVGKADIELVDAAGRTLARRSIGASATEGSIAVSELAPGLQKGVYLLRFRSDAAVQATRFVLE